MNKIKIPKKISNLILKNLKNNLKIRNKIFNLILIIVCKINNIVIEMIQIRNYFYPKNIYKNNLRRLIIYRRYRKIIIRG